MASSSSSLGSPKLYDAFISHRGPDVKETLAKQLYHLLQERGCRAFLDCEEIQGGDSIPFAIRNAICSSLVQIAIFSKGYADSSWCLDELVLMLQQPPDALFIPVFYDVQPWELRHIENEKSQYAVAFSDRQRKGRNLDKLDEWKKALESAADISGYELSHSSHQDNLCENIVSRVLQVVQERKNRIPLDVAKYPVGLAELVQDFKMSCSQTKRQRKVTRELLGIYGLGGSGKTTLAKELFNRKRLSYHASCFLSDVRESHARGELHRMQSQLLKDLLNIADLNFSSVHHGIGELKDRLGRARHLHFLIVLDDIDHQDQLDALLPQGMLSLNSLVIITTRDQSMLKGADICYKMKGLNRNQAKDLFCSHAFLEGDPPIAYEKLVESFVEFCGGLPLSLKVLGAHLYGRDEYYWELQLEKVKKIPPKDIIQRLKISFDGLDQEEKQIFIDIACLFNKKSEADLKSIAISIWNASGWSAEHAVQILQDKCLIEVGSGLWAMFRMHDHLRDLGRQMADELGPPRLWRPHILTSMEAKGLKQILAETKGRCFHSFKDSSLKSTITFFIMNSNDSAETDLLWLEILNESSSLKEIPSWIPLRKLQCLSIYNMEELWSTFQQQLQTNTQASFELRMLKIYYSSMLQKIPDLIGMFSHLQDLGIRWSLEKTDITSLLESLKQLSNLRSLWLRGKGGIFFSKNLNLSKVTDSTSSRMTSLENIDFSRFSNISKLLISGEICPRLRSLKVDNMWDLIEMDLKQLDRLNTLDVSHCGELETISGFSSLIGLQFLRLEDCPKLETIIELSSAIGLQYLIVQRCPKLETILGSSSLTGLQYLILKNCHKWITVPGLSSLTGLQVFRAEECGFNSLPTLAHLHLLERITISKCYWLQSVEGFEGLQGLKSLIIDLSGYAWRLPSDYTILTGVSLDTSSSRLDVNLFSEVMGTQTVIEIEKLDERSSSNAITIYAFLGRYNRDPTYIRDKFICLTFVGEQKIGTEIECIRISGFNIKKGFKVTMNEGEGGQALMLMQRIFDRLYGDLDFERRRIGKCNLL
ncbi:disease resistance protein Roq1 isoform X2 [Cryptomeria japonica]|uniref:disease resistance protein Roq1 isoform X2 n=1 Tax=Cryptomeria japonica TaxID=3369 RepID=UPI0025AC3C6D|nr:disease resistance protein Roq1 isoform X2 [Cryptomeria japonica]